MRNTGKYVDLPIREKLTTISDWLIEKKGKDLVALDLTGNHTFTEGIIIVSAGSIRHAQGLADYVLEQAKAARFEFLRMEGYQTGQWILLDCNDLVVSILVDEARDLYRLEDLWKTAPIVVDDRQPAS